MEHQTKIIQYYGRMRAIQMVVGYGVSALFIVTAAFLVVFAPETRALAADFAAGGLLDWRLGLQALPALK